MKEFAYLGLFFAMIGGLAVVDPAPDPRFEFLKGLAGGHAVEEREMVGSPHEMLTIYHMEGSDLVATHYCMLGNRPRMTARPLADAKSNLNSPGERNCNT